MILKFSIELGFIDLNEFIWGNEMFFYRYMVPGLAIQSYMIGDESTRKCAVIDPVRDVDEYLRVADKERYQITDILETHVHADYVSGSVELKSRLDGNPCIHCSGMGGEEWIPSYADNVVQDGEEVVLGEVRLRAKHTPGHTPEHVVWELMDGEVVRWLFTGDLLFVGDVGRPDLLGEEAQQTLSHQLYHSIFDKISTLSDSVEIFPAHGAGSLCGKAIGGTPSSTLGIERQQNQSLVQKEEEEWVADLMSQMPKAPTYFPRMKKINVQGPEVIGETLPGHHPFSSQEVKEKKEKGCVLLDIRSKEAFAAAHIPGSINIPLGPSLSNWAGWVIPYEKPIVIILDDVDQMESAVIELLRVGFDDVAGYLEGGIWSWEDAGLPLARIETQYVDELSEQIEKDKPFILDVRTDHEWSVGHIEGAHHIHAGLVSGCLDMVPRDQHVAVICGSGYRASMVASVLKGAGYEDISNVLGGMSAWREKGYPVVK